MLRISKNVGEEPGAELDTFWFRRFWAPFWEEEGAPQSWMLGNKG